MGDRSDALAGHDANGRGDDRLAGLSGRLGARAGLGAQRSRTLQNDRTCKGSTYVLGSSAAVAPSPTTRRSFFNLAGGAALFCTIGGRQIDVSARGGLEKADAMAAGVTRPRAAAAETVPQIQPAPGGTRREYWIQAETVRWAITPSRRDDWHGRRLSGPQRLHGVRLPAHDPRVRGLCDGRSDDPRADADRRGRGCARRAFPQRRPQAEPGGDDAPAWRQVQPGVRRRLHGRVHARGRLHRPGRDVHLPVGVHAPVGRRLAVSRPRAQPHAQHLPRAVRRDRRAPEGRQAA